MPDPSTTLPFGASSTPPRARASTLEIVDLRRIDPHRRGGRRGRRRGARPDRQVAGLRGARATTRPGADRLPGLRPEPGRPGAARGGHGRAGHPPGHGARGARADRLRDRRHPADRPRPPGARRHGPGPRPVPDRLGRRRPADRGLPGARPAHAARPGQCDGRADRRGRRAAAPSRPRASGALARADARRRGPRRGRTAQRDRHVPGRPARALALGRAAARAPRSSRCPRRAARSSTSGRASPTTRTRCVAPSCASRARAGRGPRASPRRSTTSRAPCSGTRRAAGRGLRLPHVRPRRPRRGEPAGTTARRRRSWRCSDRRGCATCSSRPRSRPSRSSPTGRSPGAWRTTDVVTAAELVGGRLVLTGYDGQLNALDPATGRVQPAEAPAGMWTDRWITSPDRRRHRGRGAIDPARPRPYALQPARRGRTILTAAIASTPTCREVPSGLFMPGAIIAAVTPLLLLAVGLVALVVGVADPAQLRAATSASAGCSRSTPSVTVAEAAASPRGRRATSPSAAASTPRTNSRTTPTARSSCAATRLQLRDGRPGRPSIEDRREAVDFEIREGLDAIAVDQRRPRRRPRRHAARIGRDRGRRPGPRARPGPPPTTPMRLLRRAGLVRRARHGRLGVPTVGPGDRTVRDDRRPRPAARPDHARARRGDARPGRPAGAARGRCSAAVIALGVGPGRRRDRSGSAWAAAARRLRARPCSPAIARPRLAAARRRPAQRRPGSRASSATRCWRSWPCWRSASRTWSLTLVYVRLTGGRRA